MLLSAKLELVVSKKNSATIKNRNRVVIVKGNKGVRHRKVINKYTIEGAHVGSSLVAKLLPTRDA